MGDGVATSRVQTFKTLARFMDQYKLPQAVNLQMLVRAGVPIHMDTILQICLPTMCPSTPANPSALVGQIAWLTPTQTQMPGVPCGLLETSEAIAVDMIQ